MNWLGLLRNQWFQLCLIAALCSAAAGIFDLVTNTAPPIPAPSPKPYPSPGNPPASATPSAAIAQLHAKTAGHWIVDASGAGDSDSTDLQQIVESAANGDTITVRPGRYGAALYIDKDLSFVGEGTSPAIPLIFSSQQKNVLHIMAGHVTFWNLQIEQDYNVSDANGALAALYCGKQAHVELAHCSVTSKAKFGISADEDAQLDVTDSNISSSEIGFGIVFSSRAHGTVTRSTFVNNRSGLQAENQSRVTADGCTFQDNGYRQLHANAVYVGGDGASLDVERSTFSNNSPGVADAEESGKLNMTGCVLENNGISLESDGATDGMIVVQTGAQAKLANLICKSNKQGIAVLAAGNALLNNVSMSNTGIATNNTQYAVYCNAIYLDGDGTTVSISESTISDSVYNGVFVADRAKATLQKCSISNSKNFGLLVGADTGAAPAYGSVTDSSVVSNHLAGIKVQSGSSVEVDGGEISGNGMNGIEVLGNATTATMTNRVLVQKQVQTGLLAYSEGLINVKDCTIESNQYGVQAGIGNKGKEFGGTIILESSTVQNNSAYGALSFAGSTITLKQSNFKNNQQDFWLGGGIIQH